MSVLSSVLQVKPSTWSSQSYIGKTYALIEVESYSLEFERVRNIFINNDITQDIRSVKRVQHPFAYGRFLLRKEQFKFRGIQHKPKQLLFKLCKSNVADALEFNFDRRRTSFSKMTDYLTCDDNDCIIIVSCLYDSHTCITRDSELYPEYVVYCH